MLITTPAIVLSGLKYGETNLIVKALTRDAGLRSYWVPGVYGGKKGRMKPSFFQPLTVLEITAIHKSKGSLERLKEVRALPSSPDLTGDVRKLACCMLISEVLSESLADEQHESGLFEYLEHGLRWLAEEEFCPLFPSYFLWNLTAYLGFYPDTSGFGLGVFDLKEGVFAPEAAPLRSMGGEDAQVLLRLVEAGWDELHSLSCSRGQPREQLLWVIKYFEFQVQGFRTPRSLAVWQEVFK